MADKIKSKNHKLRRQTDRFPHENFDFQKTVDAQWLKCIAIDTSITGIMFTGMDGKIFYANEAAVRMWGYTDPSEYIGKFAAKFGQSWDQIVNVFYTAMATGSWIGEIGGVRKDGSKHYVYLQANLIRNKAGDPVCLMCSFMDITKQKELMEQMRIKDVAIEKSITGIILTDPKGIITFANDATASIWGYDKSEFLGKYAAKFAQSWAQIINILNIVYQNGFWRGEIGGIRKDGALITVHLSASLIRDTSDEPVCIMCSFVDVTEQKHLQEQMRIKENALASSINGMAITDIDGKIIYVNDAFYDMWGEYFHEEVIGRNLMHFAESKQVAKEIYNAVTNDGKWFGELMVKRRDGSTFEVQCAMNTVIDPDTDTRHVFYAFVDITDRRNAEKALQQSHDDLEKRVMERTAKLRELVAQNGKEIEERKQAEKLLLQKESDLLEKSSELEEMNAALKVLLKQRESDKEELETDVFENVNKNILPYIQNLLGSKKLNVQEREYILTIQKHIHEIVSPFLRKLQVSFKKLTPTEIKVANLIRDEKSTKEIAQLLNTSTQAVEFHRKNIRRKLNLNHSKVNLRTHLLSLT